jgi:hypothetical protein
MNPKFCIPTTNPNIAKPKHNPATDDMRRVCLNEFSAKTNPTRIKIKKTIAEANSCALDSALSAASPACSSLYPEGRLFLNS